MNHVHASCLLRPETNVGLPGILVTDVCEPACGYLEPHQNSLKEQ